MTVASTKPSCLVLFAICAAAGCRHTAGEAPQSLKPSDRPATESVTTNIPTFSWQFTGHESEKAYRLVLSDSSDFSKTTWDTGVVWEWDKDGALTKGMTVYSGPPLAPGRTYYWKVKTWDGSPAAW